MECGEVGAGLRIRVQPGGEVTAGAARVQGAAAPVRSPTELQRRGSFSLRLGGGENLTSLGDLGLELETKAMRRFAKISLSTIQGLQCPFSIVS